MNRRSQPNFINNNIYKSVEIAKEEEEKQSTKT